jgi:hypothetical protein
VLKGVRLSCGSPATGFEAIVSLLRCWAVKQAAARQFKDLFKEGMQFPGQLNTILSSPVRPSRPSRPSS